MAKLEVRQAEIAEAKRQAQEAYDRMAVKAEVLRVGDVIQKRCTDCKYNEHRILREYTTITDVTVRTLETIDIYGKAYININGGDICMCNWYNRMYQLQL
jgi:uncharacterized membrane protein